MEGIPALLHLPIVRIEIYVEHFSLRMTSREGETPSSRAWLFPDAAREDSRPPDGGIIQISRPPNKGRGGLREYGEEE